MGLSGATSTVVGITNDATHVVAIVRAVRFVAEKTAINQEQRMLPQTVAIPLSLSNLIPFSDELDQWTFTSGGSLGNLTTVTNEVGFDPFGGAATDEIGHTLEAPARNIRAEARQNIIPTKINTDYNVSVYSKQNPVPDNATHLHLSVTGGGIPSPNIAYDMRDGGTNIAGGQATNIAISTEDQGFYRCSFAMNSGPNTVLTVRMTPAVGSAASQDTLDSDVPHSLWWVGMQFTEGSTLKPYQGTSGVVNSFNPTVVGTVDDVDTDVTVSVPVMALTGNNVSLVTGQSDFLYPLLGTVRVGTFNYALDYPEAATDRLAMGLLDAVLLGGFFEGVQDSPSNDYLTRVEVSQSLLDNHQAAYGTTSDFYMGTYLIQMSANDQGNDELGAKCLAETGPNGTDWFLRNENGDVVINSGESPGSGGMTLLHGTATPDSLGRDFAEFYTDTRVTRDFLDLHAAAGIGVGMGGMNGWWDNFGVLIRKSGADPDQSGVNNDMQQWYNWDDPNHMSGVDENGEPRADAVGFVGAYRFSQRRGMERAITAYPGLLVGGNTNQWNHGAYSGPATNLPEIMREYRRIPGDGNDPGGNDREAYNHVGLSENNNWRPTELKDGYMRSHTLWTGVSSQNGNEWQESFNNIATPLLALESPGILFGEWIVDCLQNGTTVIGPPNRIIWPNIPKSGSAWNAERWGHATNAMCGAHHCCSGVIDQPTSTTGERRATPLFDEYGLINGSIDYGFGAGGTKLYRKWMGRPIDGPQLQARTGMLWWREFDNCLVVLNTNWDDTLPPITVIVANLPGGANEWMRFNGVQDPSWNNGNNASSNFTIPSIDAIFLVRRSWYENL
jgi:hypothetical protein